MPHPSRVVTLALLALWLALPAPSAAQQNPQLVRPPDLEPNVRFWERVYSEVASDGGLIHDSEHLDVVYERIRLPEGLSRRSRQRRIEHAKDRIRAALRSLARGKRSGLSPDEAEVLSRWPEGVSNVTLRRAVGNVRFQLGQADRFRAGLVRSGAWMDMIRETMRRYGVPEELAVLPHVESSFNPGAYSRVGASGMWQFTRSTGRLFMRIDSVVDERLDPWIATDAAARLLLKNYELTRSWPLAITSYNHGAAGMQRAARKLGTRDIATIVRKYNSRTFGFASRNFYASFLAAYAVDQRADEIFGVIERDRPIEYTLIEMPHYYRATSLAAALGVDTETLRRHNNALRPAVWQGNKFVPRGYVLRVPSRHMPAPPEQVLASIPPDERLARQHRDRFHKVRRGETLSVIARRYGLRVRQLVELNNLRSQHRIRAGQILTLPGGSDAPVAVAVQDPPPSGYYTVRRGDNLSSIGHRFGVSPSELVSVNGLRNRNRISVGQRLRIPGAETVAVASASGAETVAVASASDAATSAASAPQPESAAAEPRPPTQQQAQPAAEPELPAPTEPAQEPESLPVELVEGGEPPAAVAEPGDDVRLAAIESETGTLLPDAPEADAVLADQEPEADAVVAAHASGAVPPPPDPSDYSVHDRRVTVQAAETLGHYAEWLEVRTNALRRLNHMRMGQPLVIGRRVKLDFSRVTPEEFENRRLEYHRTLQGEFFDAFEVTGTERHVLRRGESLWYLAERKYRVPIWLLRLYNPDLDFGSLQAGVPMVVPVVEPRAS
jgi:membrane-bound lytic murein transglycosylase D